MSTDQASIIYNICRYLESLKGDGKLDDEKVSTITNILESAYSVSNTTSNFSELSYFPTTFNEIFDAGVASLNIKSAGKALESVKSDAKFEAFVDMVTQKGFFDGCEKGSLEYLQRQSKLVSKFSQKKQTAEPTTEELEAQAEEKKSLGNSAMTAKKYVEAIQYYTEAIELSPEGPNSHIYYSNRAAAYCYTNQYELSVLDCESSVNLKPDYAKAHARLGFSNFHLGRYEEAASAYETVVELEPNNKEHQEALRKAKKKLEKTSSVASSSSSSSIPSSSGAPDLSSLASMLGGGGGSGGAPPGMDGLLKNPKMKDAFDKMGGMDGLSNLMKDPNMMAMAQNMMKNPAMMQQAMSMMNGGGGGSGGGDGGMPDMSALAGLMGGLGGGGAGSSAGSSGSSSNKKGPFKGFEE